jgi:hypothetical protein
LLAELAEGSTASIEHEPFVQVDVGDAGSRRGAP